MKPAAPLRLRAPSSKSLTQRALVLAALAPGESELVDPLECDDSRALREALAALGASVQLEAGLWRVRGGTLRPATRPLWCGDAGTALRFLAPLALLLDGELVLEGSARLGAPPVADLLAALGPLGVDARPTSATSGLPLWLRRARAGGRATRVSLEQSSQFASGLLMVGPHLPAGLELGLEVGPAASGPVSRPYVDLTLRAMAAFGVTARDEGARVVVPPAPYRPCRFPVEGDWSAGAFLLVGGRLAGRTVEVENLDSRSAQGDRAIAGFLEQLERDRPHDFDLGACPDLIAPLAAAAARARHPVRIRNVAHARLKESDRVAVLAAGLRLAGLLVEERPDGLTIEPGGALRPALLDPAGDHRMAMAFGLLSLIEPGIRVSDPGCVSKSYPGFWADLERLRQALQSCIRSA